MSRTTERNHAIGVQSQIRDAIGREVMDNLRLQTDGGNHLARVLSYSERAIASAIYYRLIDHYTIRDRDRRTRNKPAGKGS